MRLGYLRLVFKDINNRKFSSFLTLFAISLGIVSIFVISLLGAGFESSIENQFEMMGSNRLYVSSESNSIWSSSTSTKGLTDDEVSLVESRAYVKKVYPYYSRSAQLKYGNDFSRASVMGTRLDEQFFTDYNFEIMEGRFARPNEKYSIIMGSLAAEELFDKEVPVGGNVYVRDIKFKVVGILESIGSPQDDSAVYFNIDTLRDIYDDGDNVGFMDVEIVEGYDINLAAENLEVYLENRLGKDTIDIITPTQLLEQVGSILGIIQVTLGGIAFVSLIVGAVGIINTMFVVVTEKKRDIGIMKSIGATNTDILFMYIFEAGLFGFLGAILGVIMGSGLALLVEAFAQSAGFSFLEVPIRLDIAAELLFFGFAIGVIAGFIPSYKASKTNIIEAIRK